MIGGPDHKSPSPASGTTDEARLLEYKPLDEDSSMPKVCWLLEPLRTTSYTRYTGTLRHPTLRGKLGSSIHAFVHFAFEMSSRDMLFADIQGEYCYCYCWRFNNEHNQALSLASQADCQAMYSSTS